MRRWSWSVPLAALLLAACATQPRPSVTPALAGDPAHPAQAAGWVRSELYFGIGLVDGPGDQADARWQAFLDREVTPRFPDGLTVLDGQGQWLSQGARTPERLRTKVLVILHEDSPRRGADIDAIRQAWKQLSGDASVLWVRQPAQVSF